MRFPRIDYPFRTPLMFFAKDGDGEGGGGGQDWKDALPDELKVEASLADFQDIPALAKAFVETKKMVGNSLRVPGEEAGTEAWETFHNSLISKAPGVMIKPDPSDDKAMNTLYNQLGRPETYKDTEVDTKGVKVNKDFIPRFKETAHKAGLSQKQVDAILTDIITSTVDVHNNQQALMDTDTKELVEKLGARYDQDVRIARTLAEKTNAPKWLMDPLNTANPPKESVLFFLGLAESLGVETSELVKQAAGSDVMTPDEAQRTMDEMRDNKDNPLWNPRMAGHKAALAKFDKLSKYAHPE